MIRTARLHNIKNITYLVAAFLILSLGIILRIWKADLQGLYYDELQSVTFAHLRLWELFPNVYQFDPHPFLYYLQLHFWMKAGTSDLWLRYNSALWSIGVVASMVIICRRIFNDRIALVSAALFTLSPLANFYGQQVRMYAMMMFLAFWIWYFTHQFFHSKAKYIYGFGLIISSLLFLYTHGSAFLIYACTISFALLTSLQKKHHWDIFFWWLALQGLIFIGYTFWLIHAQSIIVMHTLRPSFLEITRTLAELIYGMSSQGPGLQYFLAWLILLGMILFLFLRNREIIFMTSYLIAPLVTCLFISYTIRPIWLTRTISFITPFFSISLAIAISELYEVRFPDRFHLKILPKVLLAIVLFASLLFLVYQKNTYRTVWDLREPVYFISRSAGKDDVIAIDNERVYWGWCWYAIGPGCSNPRLEAVSGVDKDGRLVLSAQPFEHYLKAGRTVWYVYRSQDSKERLPDLPDLKRDLVYDHLDLFIERLHILTGNQKLNN